MGLNGNKQLIKSTIKGFKNKIDNSPLYGRTLIMLFFIALFMKGIIIYFSYKNFNPRENVVSYLASDVIILFFVHLLITINYWIKKRSLRLLIDFVVFIILLLYLIDMFTLFVFHSRVAIVEVLALGSNGSSGFDGLIRLWISIFIISALLIFFLVQTKMSGFKKSGKNMVIAFSGCSILYAIFFIVIAYGNVNINHIENIVSLNIQKIKEYKSNYNEEELEKLEEIQSGYSIESIQGEGKDLNIILVFAESISAIDSANVGGNDKMPKFDQIQNNGITFTNFIANGTTSDTAHIATLLGVIPLRNMRVDNTPYSGYKLKMKALPDYLNDQGYMTTFISTASLDFLKQRDFLSGAGFQKIIGEEAFEDDKKYTFDSAPDEELYKRTLEEVQNQTGKYFIGLQTISFHKPYNTPLGKTEELALQYSDEELYKFYQSLNQLGFFENGILVIVGDHRKMNAVEQGEAENFGPNWYTRAVATVIGSGIIPGTVNSNIVQHTDFYNSLKRLLGHGSVEVDYLYNDIFTQKVNRNWGITNSSVYIENGYTISSNSGDVLLFKNLSNLSKDNQIYDYFASYIGFEFGNKKNDEISSGTGENNKNRMTFIGHRGAIENSPENTLESFLVANELGADGVEFDVSYTKDHQNIVAHGEWLYASNCNRQKVWNLDFERITKNCTITNGEKYMTLKNMLELIDGLFDYYFLEIKVYDEELGAQQTMEAIQTVKDLNMQDKVIFISYSDSAREILDSDSDIIYGWDTFDVNDLDFIGENNSKYFLAPYDSLTPEIVQRARDLGKEVVTYTVNETGDFQAMKDLGINIIMSDRIDLLQEYNSVRHYPVPHSFSGLNLRKSLYDELS